MKRRGSVWWERGLVLVFFLFILLKLWTIEGYLDKQRGKSNDKQFYREKIRGELTTINSILGIHSGLLLRIVPDEEAEEMLLNLNTGKLTKKITKDK